MKVALIVGKQNSNKHGIDQYTYARVFSTMKQTIREHNERKRGQKFSRNSGVLRRKKKRQCTQLGSEARQRDSLGLDKKFCEQLLNMLDIFDSYVWGKS